MIRFLRDWDVFLVILATGLLAGLVTFMAADTHPAACRHATVHGAVRSFTWICAHP